MNSLQLFNACADGDVAVVKRLLAEGIDINRASVAGFAPIHVATMNGQVAVLQLLLEHPEIDLFLKSADTEQTALEIAQRDLQEDGKAAAAQCIHLIQCAMCVYSEWLSPRLEGGKFLSTIWEKRYGRAFRTPNPRVLELQLYESPTAKSARAFLRVDLDTAEFKLGSGMSRKSHRFELKAGVHGDRDPSRLHRFEFAVENKQALDGWKAVFDQRPSKLSFSSSSRSSFASPRTSQTPIDKPTPKAAPAPAPAPGAAPGAVVRLGSNLTARASPQGLVLSMSLSSNRGMADSRGPSVNSPDPSMPQLLDRPPSVMGQPHWAQPPALEMNDLMTHGPPNGGPGMPNQPQARQLPPQQQHQYGRPMQPYPGNPNMGAPPYQQQQQHQQPLPYQQQQHQPPLHQPQQLQQQQQHQPHQMPGRPGSNESLLSASGGSGRDDPSQANPNRPASEMPNGPPPQGAQRSPLPPNNPMARSMPGMPPNALPPRRNLSGSQGPPALPNQPSFARPPPGQDDAGSARTTPPPNAMPTASSPAQTPAPGPSMPQGAMQQPSMQQGTMQQPPMQMPMQMPMMPMMPMMPGMPFNAEPNSSMEEQQQMFMAMMMSMAEMQLSQRAAMANGQGMPYYPPQAYPQAYPGYPQQQQQQYNAPPGYPPAAPQPYADPHAQNRPHGPRDESTECVICKDAPRCVACIPCGHRTMCDKCAQEVLERNQQCPVCRQPVRDLLKTYG